VVRAACPPVDVDLESSDTGRRAVIVTRVLLKDPFTLISSSLARACISLGGNVTSSSGKVYLVGAGPGDPGLITLRGAELLANADLVLYDGLVNPLLLDLTNGRCERTARSRSGTHAIVPQEDINARLIAEARAGCTVVRLKGGDPFIFGRGSEEAAALEEAGIPFEVVPGITAATAAGGYAGFSYTHRAMSSAVAFVTGHETRERDISRLDYDALARFPGTLVFYMGLAQIHSICGRLMEAGMSPQTPAAVVCHASLPTQRVVAGHLISLADDVERAELKAPSLIVVGDCVDQRSGTSWFESLPLFGLRIGITRPRQQARSVVADVVRQGGHPVVIPMIDILPVTGEEKDRLENALHRLESFDWLIVTSVNGIRSFMEQLWEFGRDARCLGRLKLAAIGTSTADELRKWSLRADIVSDNSSAESLAAALAPHVSGRRCLWVAADRVRDVLGELLLGAGATVERLTVYRNVDADVSKALRENVRQQPLDWIGLSSPAIARRAAEVCPELIAGESATRIATISPLTTEAAETVGLTVHAEAAAPHWVGILKAIAGATAANAASTGELPNKP